MDADWLLVGGVVVVLVYFAGYTGIAALAGLLIAIMFFASVIFEAKPKAESSTQVLEPIIIESTRGAPYKIPEKMGITYDRKAKPGPKWVRIQEKWGKALGQMVEKGRE